MSDLIRREDAIQEINAFDYRGLSLEDVHKVTDGCAAEVNKLPAVDAGPKWISVEDRFPDNSNKRVLVKIADDDLIIGNPAMDTDRYFRGSWVRYCHSVTHWMPLPEPPKMDGGM